MIKIRNLSFIYNNQNPVFQNISLDLTSGINGILGGNGVGKSSLLKLIAGLRFPSEGKCSVLGYETKFRNPNILNQIYYLGNEIPTSSQKAYEYANQIGKYYPLFSTTDFLKYLEKLEVEKQQPITTLSLGQKKKVHLALGISLNTPILLLDEPTNELDIPSKEAFKKILASQLDEDKCIVVTTHQVSDFENLIDPIILLDRNNILLKNSVEEITSKLVFSMEASKPKDAIHYIDKGFGYLTLRLNENNAHTPIDLELLFDAARKNKLLFEKLFMNNSLNILESRTI